MKSSTVNISFNNELLAILDKIAREESRSRSELIREAARFYIERKRRWRDIYKFGRMQSRKNRLTEEDLQKEISRVRSQKRH